MKREPRLIDRQSELELIKTAGKVRKDVLRMIYNAGSGNPGSALSATDLLVWLLHWEMRIDRDNPDWKMRDRLILSKGHCAPAFYSICSRLGWIKQDELTGFRRFDSRLQTHPEYGSFRGIDFPSGSLGQGLSGANGMALAARYLGLNDIRFFVIIGDGELQEGQVWEAAMTAAHYRLMNVVVLIDRNQFQGDSATSELMNIEPLQEKWRSFGWHVVNSDGHSFREMSRSFREVQSPSPKVIIAHTVKGRGVSFMEGDNAWHVSGKKFNQELLSKALAELSD